MKRTFWLCTLSALLGGSVAVVLTVHSPQPQLAAQDQAAANQDRELADGLTPEERVNIAVYDKVNRSVVNIETRMMRAEMLFMTEAPAEGAGSRVRC